jgi:6,7-dimethyl-8-ribityllumazine synthase
MAGPARPSRDARARRAGRSRRPPVASRSRARRPGDGGQPGARIEPAAGPAFAIVAARFNERITRRLVDGAVSALVARGIPESRVEVYWAPGSFELPQAALQLARTGRFAGLVCLGVVIRGQTPHFEHVAREAASGIRQVALSTGVPATFGVITALTEEQAWDRAGGEVGNRGQEAAEAALEMAELVERVNGRGKAP